MPCGATQARPVVLTPVGVAFIERILTTISRDVGQTLQQDSKDVARPKPQWDAQRRELRFQGVVVKRFRKPAPNQELILAAFEESGWPPRIDDPLPPHSDIPPTDRLHDTLGRLNRTLRNPLIRFGGDGGGEGIYWRPA
jgi:hypothetical protein